jgi:hypothetical protein
MAVAPESIGRKMQKFCDGSSVSASGWLVAPPRFPQTSVAERIKS